MRSRSGIRLLAALGGVLLVLAAIAHERVAERCFEQGGRWQLTRMACGTRTAQDEQGAALRRAIDQEFRHRRDARMLNGPGGDRNIISDVVEAQIPPGTRLDRAATMLRHAGFQLDAQQPCGTGAQAASQCVHARIDDYAFALFGSTAVQVVLESEAGRPIVRALSAEIVVERSL